MTMENTSHFLGRQPIFNQDDSVYGYDFQFSGGFVSEKEVREFNSDSEINITETDFHFMDHHVEDFVVDLHMFVNLPNETIVKHDESKFDAELTVFEILKPLSPSEEIIEHLQNLRENGYRIAFGSFVFKKDFHPYLNLADFIKLDVDGISDDKLKAILEKIQHVSEAKLIATNVNNHQQAQLCRSGGCEYLQGHFFLQPKMEKKQQADVGKHTLMSLLEKIVDESISINDIENIVLTDAGLTHKLLQLAQKYRTEHMPNFSSIKEIITLFGMKRVQVWASEMAICSLKDVTPEVFHQARIRSLFLRHAAITQKLPSEDSYAMAGIFSLLDCILDQPLDDALAQLPINPKIIEGILMETGDYGRLLKEVKQLENFDGEGLSLVSKELFLRSIKETLNN